MAKPLPVSLFTFFLSAALLLDGCCANNVCNCDDANADAVTLRFFTGGPGGRPFAATDLDTVVLLRSPLPYNASTKPETVRLFRGPAQANDDVVLNNNTPFGQVSNTKLSHYRYEVQYLAHPTNQGTPTTVLVIDSVKLKGSLAADGCCACYTNTGKTVYAKINRKSGSVPDSAVVVDLKSKPYIVLTK